MLTGLEMYVTVSETEVSNEEDNQQVEGVEGNITGDESTE
jgi:hypothetical protein